METLRKLNLLKRLSEKQILLLIFIIALVARIGIIVYFGQEQELYENGHIALNLVSGNGFSMEFFSFTGVQESCVMAPAYPFIIAFSYMIFGINSMAILGIQIFQAIIGALTVIPVYYLCRKFYSHRISVFAGIFVALYPDFLYSAYIVNQLILTTFFVPTLVLFSYNLIKDPTHKRALFCGILYGFSFLVEPILVSIFVLMILWMFMVFFIKKFREEESSILLMNLK